MLSLYDLEQSARELMGVNPRLSVKAVLVTLILSKKPNEWHQLSTIHKKSGFQPIAHGASYLNSLTDFSYIEKCKKEGVWYVRIKKTAHILRNDDFDHEVVSSLYMIIKRYHQKHPNGSALIVLLVIAIFVRKLPTTNIIKSFVGDSIEATTNILDPLKNLAALGYIQLIKDDDHRKATVYVFEVEQ